MYRAKSGLVNGNIINDLLNLCNEYFTNPFVKPYAGANSECIFCGAMELKNGGADHSAADCPVVKYQSLAEKYNKSLEPTTTTEPPSK